MIAGIVLAAGQSRRMGEPKALLRVGGRTFLDRAVSALREGGCDPVLVVTGPLDEEPGGTLAAAALELGARVAVNPAPDHAQLGSLRAGLALLDQRAEGVVVLPVDIPGVTGDHVRALIAAREQSGAAVVQPFDGERHGHPVLFDCRLWPELLGDPLPEGARSVIHAHAHERAEVAVARLPADVDTPDDYQRLLAEWG